MSLNYSNLNNYLLNSGNEVYPDGSGDNDNNSQSSEYVPEVNNRNQLFRRLTLQSNQSGNIIDPISRRLSFESNEDSSEVDIPKESFEEYLEKHNEKINTNIDELVDFDKEKLIQKLLENKINQTREQLLEKDFGELWDLLINNRISEYSKTFSDTDYENYMEKLLRKCSLYKKIRMNRQFSNNYIYNYNNGHHSYGNSNLNIYSDDSSQPSLVNNNSQQIQGQPINRDRILLYINQNNQIILPENDLEINLINIDRFLKIFSRNYNLYILTTTNENLYKHLEQTLRIMNISQETLTQIYGEELEYNSNSNFNYMNDLFLQIETAFFMKKDPDSWGPETLDFEYFFENKNKWFTTILFLYYFKKLEESSDTKLHETILSSNIFTKDIHENTQLMSDKIKKCWDFLSLFVEHIVIPFYKNNGFFDDLIDTVKSFIEEEGIDKFIDPEDPEYVWQKEEESTNYSNSFFLKKEISEKYFTSQMTEDIYNIPVLIQFYKIFLTSSTEQPAETEQYLNQGNNNGNLVILRTQLLRSINEQNPLLTNIFDDDMNVLEEFFNDFEKINFNYNMLTVSQEYANNEKTTLLNYLNINDETTRNFFGDEVKETSKKDILDIWINIISELYHYEQAPGYSSKISFYKFGNEGNKWFYTLLVLYFFSLK